MAKAQVKLGVSSCLLGNRVRYDGGHRRDAFIAGTLGTWCEIVPVCPEVEAGLSIPRQPMQLTGDPEYPRLIVIGSRIDLTGTLRDRAGKRAKELGREGICGFIGKSRSPSCAVTDADLFGPTGRPKGTTAGLFITTLTMHHPHLPSIDEQALSDPVLRGNFIGRALLYARWTSFAARRPSPGNLVAFHSDQKLRVMAHSPDHCAALGRLVAAAKGRPIRAVYARYISLLMEGMSIIATPGKNANVLQHIMGYFKKRLSAGEKRGLLKAIEQHRTGQVPLTVPLALLRRIVRKYGEHYLERQSFLEPGPPQRILGRRS